MKIAILTLALILTGCESLTCENGQAAADLICLAEPIVDDLDAEGATISREAECETYSYRVTIEETGEAPRRYCR